MKPKEYRDRLFRTGKPNIREAELWNGENYGKDMAVLWATYKKGMFGDLDISQEDFSEYILDEAAQYPKRWVIEDKNSNFKDGYGPVGLLMAVYNGWEMEPHIEHFPWATTKNKLRSVVSFLQMMRYDKDVGIVNVYAVGKEKRFFKHITKYGVLNYAARIPHGDEKGDRHIFWVRGRK